QIGARRQREEVLFLHERTGLVERLTGIVHVAFAGGVAVGDFGQYLADDGVFAVGATQIGVVPMGRKGSAVQRQGEFQHVGADGGQVALGLLQGVIGFAAALQCVPAPAP